MIVPSIPQIEGRAQRSLLRDVCTLVIIVVLGICTGKLLAQGSLFTLDLTGLIHTHLHTDGASVQTNGGFVMPSSTPPNHHEPQLRHHEPQAHLMDGVRTPVQYHSGHDTL